MILIKFLQRIKRRFNLKTPVSDKYYELRKVPRYTTTSVELHGKTIIVPDSASFLAMYREIFEKEIYRFETEKANPVIIDGGANIGMASIYFKILFPEAKIFAFEPDPNIYDMLQRNMEVFGLDNIQLIQKGLWNENGKLNFISEGADSGLFTNIANSPGIRKEIEVISLKPYLEQKIDFLKLDIEGAETVVLRDIQENLNLVDRIFVEYHSFVDQEQSLDEIIGILKNSGFRVYVSAPGNTIKSPFCGLKVYNNMDLQLNIFGFKKGLKL